MADFFPRQGPEYQDENLRRLVKWVESEFQKLARTQAEATILPMQEHHVEVEKPREGMVARADGSDWNPGAGKGTYEYVSGAWRRMYGLADGDYGDITVSSSGGVLTIDNDVVTNAKLANMAQATVKGRAAGAGTGDPTDLTQTQLTALVNTFTTALSGAVPASGSAAGNFLKDNGTWAAAGIVLQVLQATYATNANLTTVIPLDDTVPTNTEGDEVLSQAITLSNAANRVFVEFSGWGATSAGSNALSYAIFRGSTCIQSGYTVVITANFPVPIGGAILETPGSVGPHTYSVRVGPSGAVNARLNGSAVGRAYGGSAKATLTLTELKP